MSTPTHITSSSHLNQLLKSNTYTIADFYADWCGPCKAIAPTFNQLASTHTKPGRVCFVKIDVDANQDIARNYGVSAMPTFLILKGNTVAQTIRGVDVNTLRSAVTKAASDAEKGPASQSAVFSSKGHKLGSAPPSNPGISKASGGRALGSGSAASGLNGWIPSSGGYMDLLVRFLGLYFVSLFAFDAMGAAEKSSFAVRRR